MTRLQLSTFSALKIVNREGYFPSEIEAAQFMAKRDIGNSLMRTEAGRSILLLAFVVVATA